jgi:hypothetical protein
MRMPLGWRSRFQDEDGTRHAPGPAAELR